MPRLEGLTAIEPGWHSATIEGFDYRSSASNKNPMVVVELALDTGELVNGYLMVTQDGLGFIDFLRACDQPAVADAISKKLNPSFDLETLVGTSLRVQVDNRSFIRGYLRAAI